MAEEITFDPQDLTFDELDEIEAITGLPVGEALASANSAKVMRALTYMVMRRTNPTLTIEDMGSVTIRQVPKVATDEDPTEAAG